MNPLKSGRGRSEELGYDPATGAYHCHHDWTGSARLSQTVTEVLLALAGMEPRAGPPLSDVVDPDALNRLFERPAGAADPDDHVSFTHLGCTVLVYRDGHVVAYPPDASPPEATD